MRCNITFLSCEATDNKKGMRWCHWHWCQVMPLHWCQHHVMWRAPSLEPLHSLGQDYINKVKHDSFDHMMPLSLALGSHATNCIINGTVAFLRLRWMKWAAKWLFGHVMLLELASVSHAANGFINGTLQSSASWLKWNVISFFCGQWHHWNWCWQHVMPTVLSMAALHSLDHDTEKRCNIIFLVMWHHWCWHRHCMTYAPEQICLLHCICMSHCTNIWSTYRLNITV